MYELLFLNVLSLISNLEVVFMTKKAVWLGCKIEKNEAKRGEESLFLTCMKALGFSRYL